MFHPKTSKLGSWKLGATNLGLPVCCRIAILVINMHRVPNFDR